MNVIAFDIFRCFCDARGAGPQLNSGNKRKKFLLYFLYALGVPILISIATVIAEYTDVAANHDDFKPMFGARKCFFDDDSKPAQFIFFHLPLLLIQVPSLVQTG